MLPGCRPAYDSDMAYFAGHAGDQALLLPASVENYYRQNENVWDRPEIVFGSGTATPIRYLAQCPGKFIHGVGLVQKLETMGAILGKDGTVAAGQDHRKPGIKPADLLAQFDTRHARHDNVGEDDIEAVAPFGQYGECTGSIDG